jgi:hypothetical protein
MKSRLALLNTVLIIFIVIGLGILFRGRIIGLWDDWMVNDSTPEPVAFTNFLNTNTYTDTNDNTNSEINENVNTEPEPIVLPDEINLDVPFTSQAPHSNWELPYQEACEEASAITVHYYYQSKTFTKDIADQEIKDLVAWEEENIGFYKDTTAAETAQFMKD